MTHAPDARITRGEFWPYHDVLYANAPKTSPEDLKVYAPEVGLDLPAFDQCIASAKHQAAVQKDVEEGTRAGVTGTPALFINGRLLSGAQPLESFARVIEDELVCEKVGPFCLTLVYEAHILVWCRRF